MRAAAGSISRARARARAHPDRAADGRERGELQGGELCVDDNLTHAWPRASSAAGQARRDTRGCGRARASKGERTLRKPLTVLSSGALRVSSFAFFVT